MTMVREQGAPGGLVPDGVCVWVWMTESLSDIARHEMKA